MDLHRKRGFTLIELLVVIAIISLLISVVMPSLRHARQLAQRVTCTSNQHGIAVAAIAYMTENNQRFMFQHAATQFAIPNALISSTAYPNWISRVWPYIDGNKDAFRCPANKWRHDDSDTLFKPTQEEEFSYVANGIIAYHGRLQRTPPASIVAFFDDYDNGNGAVLRPHFRGTMQPGNVIQQGSNGWVGWMRYSNGTKLTGMPHDGRVNTFLDGSANWYREDELTSRKYGLLINGRDTYEPEGSSYDDQNRWGIDVVR